MEKELHATSRVRIAKTQTRPSLRLVRTVVQTLMRQAMSSLLPWLSPCKRLTSLVSDYITRRDPSKILFFSAVMRQLGFKTSTLATHPKVTASHGVVT